MSERPICFGKIINGQRPEECIGCQLLPTVTTYTNRLARDLSRVTTCQDTLGTLQDIHDIAIDLTNRQRAAGQAVLDTVAGEMIAELVKSKQSVTDCPQF